MYIHAHHRVGYPMMSIIPSLENISSEIKEEETL